MASVQLQHICKSYDGGPAVINDVSLDIADGEFCVFVGPSGCGKSTLLRMIAGLEDISAGELLIGDRRVNQLAPSERNIAMVFQSYALYPHMDVRANIAFGLGLAGHAKAEIAQRVQRIAEVLQIVALLDCKPRSLSGGQRQRVAIGRALVRDPGVFLFDEPLSNLDASLRTHMRVEIARLHRQYGKASTIYVTHDQVEAMTLADKIVLLHSGADIARHGSVAQAGSPLELYHHPRNRFVAGFIGSPQMNFLNATVEQAAVDGVRVRSPQGALLRVMAQAERLQPGAPVSIGVRAEHLQLRASAQDNTLPCRVRWVERLGDTTYAYLETPDAQQLVARVDSEREIGVGDALHAWLPPQACHLFDADGMALARLDAPHAAAA